jgi:hypothetical protein
MVVQALPFMDHIVAVGLDSTELGNPPSKFKEIMAHVTKVCPIAKTLGGDGAVTCWGHLLGLHEWVHYHFFIMLFPQSPTWLCKWPSSLPLVIPSYYPCISFGGVIGLSNAHCCLCLQLGKPVVAHAGEEGPASYIWDALLTLKVCGNSKQTQGSCCVCWWHCKDTCEAHHCKGSQHPIKPAVVLLPVRHV